MKLKIYLTAFVLIMATLSACKKDKSAAATSSNSLSYDGNTYELASGLFVDYGTDNYYGTTPTHTNYDFYTTDGRFIFDANGAPTDLTGKIAVYAYLESPDGNGNFKEGTYTFIDTSNDGSLSDAQLKAKYENKYFFADGSVIMGNGDINASLSNAEEIFISSGTIKISGVKPNFKIEYDLILENNKTLKGSYNGEFSSYID
ncbi:MAG: hypothetical protein IE931_03080 [Sphingobacteriales bacterium]|nr:hypothetical protein [Sphingobacteriales bacterium]